MNRLKRDSREERMDADREMKEMRRAGWQSKADSMREKADKMMGSKAEYVDRAKDEMLRQDYKKKADKMRAEADRRTGHRMDDMAYKKGGSVKKSNCYAAGGVAKIRHDEATASGKPITLPKTPRKKMGL